MWLSSSCAVGPNFTKPNAPVTESWHTEGSPTVAIQSEIDTLWWQSFNDAALNRLVELAYRQNLPLQISGLRIAEARARLAIASGQQFPQVQVLTGGVTAVGVPQQVADYTRLDRNFLRYEASFDALWELDVWGKYRRGVQAEKDSTIAAEAEYDATLLSLTAEVARTYVAIRTFEVLIQQAQENARLQEEGLKIAQSRFKNGATSELDPSQATTLLESTRATIPRLQLSLQQARNALSTLLGQPTGNVDALLTGPSEIPKAPAKVAVSVPAEMLRRRPDIRSAELQAAEQCERIGIAKTSLYPNFILVGSVGLQSFSTGQANSNLFSAQSFNYQAGPRIVWPFLNYGRLINGVRVQDARFQQLLVSYRNTVLKAAQEVDDSLTGFVNTQKSKEFEEGAVVAARRAVELSLVQYREGAVDFQRVLDAQRALLNEQNSLAQTSSDVVTNLIALYKALGGGWESRQNEPFVSEATQKEMRERTNWDDLLATPRSSESKPTASPEKK